ncbi:MAG: hypothetical protein KAI96_06055 [Thermodesulfovibrionia bacterium]|nr:hypothetical protein [Thermodesulfovibrionia bacterium]
MKLKIRNYGLQSNVLPLRTLLSNMPSKLRKICILNLALCVVTLVPIASDAAYKIYLKNGRLIKGVLVVKRERARVTIYKQGIMLAFPRANVRKIEEYEMNIIREETVEKKPSPEKIPEYMQYKGREETAASRLESREETETQLKGFKKLEQSGRLPDQFKPYMDMLQKRLQEQKAR